MKKILFLIFAIVAGAGLIYLNFGYIPPVDGDTIAYYDPAARNFLEGKGLICEDGNPLPSVTGPVYPLFLALVYGIFGDSFQIVRIIQILFLAGIGVLIYLMARKHLNLSPIFSCAASLATCFWPYLFFYTTLILTEIIFIFLFMLSIYFLLEFQRTSSLKNAILSGTALGMAALTKYIVFLLPFWIILLWLILLKIPFSKNTLIAIIVFLMIVSPWLIYHWTTNPDFSYTFDILTKTKQDLKPHGFWEVNWSLWWTSPVSRAVFFWNPGAEGTRAESLIQQYSWAKKAFTINAILTYMVILGAALSLYFQRKKTLILWGTILYFWIFHTVFVFMPNPRYTLPIIPLVILLAFCALNSLINLRGPKTQESS